MELGQISSYDTGMASIAIRGTLHRYELTAPAAAPYVLVFVHGWLLSDRYWQPLMRQLAPAVQCLSYDLRGFGDSSLGEARGQRQGLGRRGRSPFSATGPYSPADYAEDLIELLQALGIERAWLVGHSLGGAIALWTAQLAPQRVKGVTCVNAGGGIYLEQEFRTFRAVGQRLVQWRPQWLQHVPLADLMFLRAGSARSLQSVWRQQRLRDFLRADAEAALGSLLQSTTEAEVHQLPWVVSGLRQPVYFVAGEQDNIMHPRYVQHLASFHPMFDCAGRNLVILPDCGHLAMLEQPERLATHLQEMLHHHALMPSG